MHFLCRLRDEAHRFAITSHRKSRDGKLQFSTLLNDIPGIGKTKGKAILAYFGSIKAMKHARVEEISKVPGISLKLAKRVVDYLKESQTTLRA
ncbi:UvrABC system protein C [Anaplasma phagocytophilum]|nr:UvrABC system protein C [Anaplasma phagocytophilum]